MLDNTNLGHQRVVILLMKIVVMYDVTTGGAPVFVRHRGLFFRQKLLEAKCVLRGQKRDDHGQDCADSGA